MVPVVKSVLMTAMVASAMVACAVVKEAVVASQVVVMEMFVSMMVVRAVVVVLESMMGRGRAVMHGRSNLEGTSYFSFHPLILFLSWEIERVQEISVDL